MNLWVRRMMMTALSILALMGSGRAQSELSGQFCIHFKNGAVQRQSLGEIITVRVTNCDSILVNENQYQISSIQKLVVVPCSAEISAVAPETMLQRRGSFDFTVNPNPTKGQVEIRIVSLYLEPFKVQVYSAIGSLVKVLEPVVAADYQTSLMWNLDASDGNRIVPGIYFIRISSPSSVVTHSINYLR